MNNNIIAHVVQRLAPGGIETMVLDLQRLSDQQVYVISLEGTKAELVDSWDALKGVQDLHFLDKKPGISLLLIIKLVRLLKTLGVRVVHTHHVGPLIYGGIAAKLINCNHVHTEHDAWHLENNKRRKIVSLCFKYFKPNIVADAQIVADNIKKYIPFCEPTVIVNGVDTTKFIIQDKSQARKQLNLPADGILIGCAARLTAVKRHDLLLAAFASLPGSNYLVFAGDGELREQLQQQAIDLNINSRVYFLGVIVDMPMFYNTLDIFCLASSMEGLPLSILEAQSAGVPVIVTDVGGSAEVVDNNTGLVIAPNNKQELIDALTRQSVNLLAINNRNKIRDFILDNCSLLKVIKKYSILYQGK